MKYKKGDRARIVSNRTQNMNSDRNMDKYLGTVMNIKEVHNKLPFEKNFYYEMR